MSALDDVCRAAQALAGRSGSDAKQRKVFEEMFCLRYGVERFSRGRRLAAPKPCRAQSFSLIAARFGVSRQWVHRVVNSMLDFRADLPRKGWDWGVAQRNRLVAGKVTLHDEALGGMLLQDAERFYRDVFSVGLPEEPPEETRLSQAQFDCLVNVGSFRFGRGLVGARMVLVDGLVTSQAAQRAQTSKQNVSNTKRRLLRWHERVLRGYAA